MDYRCTNAHDLCFGGAGGSCPECEIDPIPAGASVALVGSAQSLLEQSYGRKIDRHEVVARINTGYPKKKAQGKRTDVVFFSSWGKAAKMLPRWEGEVHPIVPARRTWLRERLGARASTGALSLAALAEFNPRKVSVYGFDWKVTPSLGAAQLNKAHHDWEAEREWALDFIAENGWTFYA